MPSQKVRDSAATYPATSFNDDLANDLPNRGLAGKAGGSVRPSDGDQGQYNLGTKASIGEVTVVSLATGAGTATPTFTGVGGASAHDAVVINTTTKQFIKKVYGQASAAAITGLTTGTPVTVYVRAVDSDGAVGPWKLIGTGTVG